MPMKVNEITEAVIGAAMQEVMQATALAGGWYLCCDRFVYPQVREMIAGWGDRNREKDKSAELLRAYLEARSPERADTALGELLSQQADPLIQAIVRSKLGRSRFTNPADVEDVCSEAAMALIVRLEEFRRGYSREPLADFRAFVSVIAYRACSGFFRRSRPEFHRLRNRLRYLLETQPSLAIWEDRHGVWWCGFEQWQNQTANHDSVEPPLDELLASGLAISGNPTEAVTQIFSRAGRPVLFDDLAQLMAGVWSVQPSAAAAEPDLLASPSPSTQISLEQRQWIERLWREIGDLPPRQRSAMLLNLHDPAGESVTTLLAVTRVAGLAEIARALEMTAEAFAAIWKDLPWSDLRIASLLGVTRQQVINLRKSARERLYRRMLGGKAD